MQIGSAQEGKDPLNEEVKPAWLTYREAQEYAGLSRTHLWKLIKANEVKATRSGRAVRINKQSLEDYLWRNDAAERMYAGEQR